MEHLREEGRAAHRPRDLVGDEFLDDVAQMCQEIPEFRQFRERFFASALRGAEGVLVLENILRNVPENPHQFEMLDRNADLWSALASKRITEARCSGCHEPLDQQGHHLAALAQGRGERNVPPTERMLARICREAVARVVMFD